MRFANREALAAYHRHGAHLETRAVVDPRVAEHWIADFELPDTDEHARREEVKQQRE